MRISPVRWIKILSCLAVAGLMLSSTLAPTFAQTAIVHFQAEGSMLKNSRLKEGRNLVGFVDDMVELENGTHQISIGMPNGGKLSVSLHVAGSNVRLVETGYNPTDCTPELKIDWPLPRIRNHAHFKGVKSIILSDPVFGASTGRMTCTSHMLLACQKAKIILAASSEPPGAEIWIDDEKAGSTNTTLSVPYCTYAESKNVLVRMKGKINCKQNIDLAPDRRVSINCKLEDP